MRNIKTILMVMLLLCLSLTVTLGLSSCEEAPHIHEFEKEVTLEATCTEAGELTFTCECGYSYTEEIKAKGHTAQIDPAVPATCTEGGLTEGSHCFDCGLVFQVQMETKPLGHKPGAEATCTTAQVCENGCGMVFVEAYDHVTLSEPTCTEDAICIVCNSVAKPALGHSEVVVPGYEAGCFTTGVTDGINCDRCHSVVVAQEVIPATGHIYTPVVTEPTCKAKGYTTYTCKCGLEYVADYTEIVNHDYVGEVTAPSCFDKGYTTYTCRFCNEASYVADYTNPTHVWEYYENNEGFERHCTNGCDTVENAAAPVADSYKASMSKNYTSDRVNQLIIRSGRYGAWGIIPHNVKWAAAPDVDTDKFPEYATMYPNIVRDFDKAGRGVEYEFVIGDDGYVDIIWHIASSAWNGSTNGGLTDMAASMNITIDGKPVDIKNLALPAGDDVNDPTWWNMHTFVIKDVALEEGVHTFKCVLTKDNAGLNVGYMEIKSNRELYVRTADVTKADVVLEGDKVFYDLTAKLNGFTVDDLELYDGSTVYSLVSAETVDGVTVLRYDITNEASVYPHLKFDGKWYVNNANWAGDVRGGELTYEHKYITLGDKHYVLCTEYSMPVIRTYTGKHMRSTSYSMAEEDGKPILKLTYLCLGYDETDVEFYDNNHSIKVLPYTVTRDGAHVTYTFDLTPTIGKNFYFHMRLEGKNWNGKDNTTSSNGDVLAPGWTGGTGWSTQKTITVNGQKYVLGIQYKMIVIGH